MIADELRKVIAGEVADDAATREKFSHDASLFEIEPSLVVFPKHARDIRKLVQFIARKKAEGEDVSLTPRAAGSDMTGGPLTESVVLDVTRHMNHIEEVTETHAITEPGVFYRDFEKETLKKHRILPSYPASREICALGGMVGNNSGGEKTLQYGKTEDYILELTVVLRDGNEYVLKPLSQKELKEKMTLQTFEGEIYRKLYALLEKNYEMIQGAKPDVSKNSAGYYLWNIWDKKTFDLTKLFVGSQGTLGIITKINVRLVPVKPHSRLLVVFLNDFNKIPEVVRTLLKYKPESLESYDKHTFKLAIKFLPSLLSVMKLGDALMLAFRFLPEAWMVLRGGVPEMILMAEFTGESEEKVKETLKRAHGDMQKLNVKLRMVKTKKDAQKYWLMRRESFNLLRKHVRGMHTAPFIDDIIVRPEHLPQFLPAVYDILSKYDLIYTVAGHVGDGNFHIIPLMDFKKKETKSIIKKLGAEVYKLVLKFNGSITAEHNDGLIRSPYLRQMYGADVYALFEEVKQIFDPDGIFNPGKKVGADAAYAFAHMVKS